MTLKPRWPRLPLFLGIGLGLFLGVGAALPLWTVDVLYDYGRMQREEFYGPLWEAVVWMVCRPAAMPPEDWRNLTLAAYLISFGSFAGFVAFWVWDLGRSRTATMPPPAEPRNEGRS